MNCNYNRYDRNIIRRGGLPRNHRGRAILRWFINGFEVRPSSDSRREPSMLTGVWAAAKTTPMSDMVALRQKIFRDE